MTALEKLIDSWEQIGRAQRQLADTERDTGLRASLIAASNAWMSAANDLKNYIQETSND